MDKKGVCVVLALVEWEKVITLGLVPKDACCCFMGRSFLWLMA